MFGKGKHAFHFKLLKEFCIISNNIDRLEYCKQGIFIIYNKKICWIKHIEPVMEKHLKRQSLSKPRFNSSIKIKLSDHNG